MMAKNKRINNKTFKLRSITRDARRGERRWRKGIFKTVSKKKVEIEFFPDTLSVSLDSQRNTVYLKKDF